MIAHGKATRITLLDFHTPQMRAFHMTWLGFFVCFFAWFGIAPLMAVVREELKLTKDQVGNTIIASVAITIVARLLIGWLCDHYGPRLTYTWFLILGSLPVMGIGLAQDYETFLLLRLAIGAIGASFVITQYHTSLMFAPNCIGTANATTAGWGNLGGGVTQVTMPLIFGGLVALGVSEYWGWRLAMVVPGVMMLLIGVAYYFLTQDTPEGNFSKIRASGKDLPQKGKGGKGTFWEACRDHRVWAVALIYGASFGVEITVHNIAALYFKDVFGMGLTAAGLIAGSFGLLAIFARSLGGWFSDQTGQRFGLKGRARLLGLMLLCEGLSLMLFSQATVLPLAVVTLMLFGLFVHISCGATYGLTPFLNRKAMGSVAGIVGAGGNVGAVVSGFVFKGDVPWSQAMSVMGMVVMGVSLLVLLVQFTPQAETEAWRYLAQLRQQDPSQSGASPGAGAVAAGAS